MKRYILLILAIFFIGINVYASDDIYVEDVTVIDKSDDVDINNFHVISFTFNNVGETIRYKIDINNKTDKNYYLTYDSKYDYIGINMRNNKIKKNSHNTIYIDITYDEEIKGNKYAIDDVLKLKLNEDSNKTIIIKSIFIFLLLIGIIIGCILISKIDSRRILRVIILGLLLLPLIGLAYGSYLKLEFHVMINYNTLAPIVNPNGRNLNWNNFHVSNKSVSLITRSDKYFDTEYTYDKTIYHFKGMFDVSERNNLQVMLAVYYSDNNKALLVMGQDGGVRLPVNSYALFKDTKFKVYDLNSADSSRVTNMSIMFRNVTTDSIDISGLDTSNVKYMQGMFYRCHIKDVNISGINTTSLMNVNLMFSGSNINNLVGYKDLDFSNVRTKLDIFKNSNINHIY